MFWPTSKSGLVLKSDSKQNIKKSEMKCNIIEIILSISLNQDFDVTTYVYSRLNSQNFEHF